MAPSNGDAAEAVSEGVG